MGIVIDCPNCRNFLTFADENDGIIHKRMCKRCGKWIWYKPGIAYTEVHDVPERTSSSGKRLY
jgi:DNA-directed RNA polymerase subunit M/transcription elongation factor TFIIS